MPNAEQLEKVKLKLQAASVETPTQAIRGKAGESGSGNARGIGQMGC